MVNILNTISMHAITGWIVIQRGTAEILRLPGPAKYASSTLDSSPPTKSIENYQKGMKK